jgi:hypothetical protein
VTALLFAVSSDSRASGADWPQWRGPNRDGKSTETGLLESWPEEGPALLWQADGAGTGYSGVAVSSGRLFTMGSDERDEFVIAYGVEKGTKLWKVRSGEAYRNSRGGGPRSTPTVEGDVLYAFGANGDLSCLAVADGKQSWHVNVVERFSGRRSNWGMSESVLIDGNKVICAAGGRDATIVALDKKTGETIWTSQGLSDRPAYASAMPVMAGSLRQIVNFTHKAAVGVSAEDGRFLWRYEQVANGVANCPTPIVDRNRVFFTSDYGAGCVLLELSSDGKAKEVYFSEELQNHHGGVIVIDGCLYGHSGGNDPDTHTFVCMDLATGKVLWKDAGIGKCSITYAEGHFYALSRDGKMALVEVSPKRFVLKSQFTFKKFRDFRTRNLDREGAEKPTWTHPVVAQKKLFLRDQGLIYCYEIEARK